MMDFVPAVIFADFDFNGDSISIQAVVLEGHSIRLHPLKTTPKQVKGKAAFEDVV